MTTWPGMSKSLKKWAQIMYLNSAPWCRELLAELTNIHNSVKSSNSLAMGNCKKCQILPTVEVKVSPILVGGVWVLIPL